MSNIRNMKIFSNVNNSQVLKHLIAISIAKLEVQLEVVSQDDPRFQDPRRLPVLQLDSGEYVFSSNAATCLLLGPCNIGTTGHVQEWLEWEMTKLQPVVFAYLNEAISGKKVGSSGDLITLLKFLSDNLKDNQYLVENTLTASDIAIWATLYPVGSDSTLSKVLPVNIIKWHSSLTEHADFKQAVKRLNPELNIALWSANTSQWAVQCSNLSLPQTIFSKDSSTPIQVSNEANIKAAKKSKAFSKPVLPVSGKRNVLITSALPYVNNVPHLGNIIGCVLSADVFARYCRGRGHPTLYISGTDEYGTATETKAIAEGLTPQQICDKYHTIHAQVYDWFNIEFDYFGRTSSKEHTEICQNMFLKLHKNELTLTESMDQLLCQNCDRFLADRFVEGECPLCGYEDARGDQCDKCGRLVNATELHKPRCKLCQQTPVTRSSTHFFLDLPKIEHRLRAWMAESSPGWTSNASIIAQTWIKDGLKPRCITRDLKWGIPVPLDGYRDKVFYVWFDAPLGYVSMTKCYTEHWEKWWKNPKEVEYFQFMAKDNVPFHSVMFPSCQLGSGDSFTIVNHIMATEYLNYEEGKFSKSRGVGVFGSDVQDTGISADVWRFYLLYVRPESQDSSFSWADLMIKNNSELLNNLGNFINRALMFLEKNFNSEVPAVEMNQEVTELIISVNIELKGYLEALEKARLRDGIRCILSISRLGNQLMQASQPWVLIKGSETDRNLAGTVIGLSANIACLLAALLRPYMPATADVIQAQLSAPNESAFNIPEKFSILLPQGHIIGKPAPLFTKIEAVVIDALRAKFAGDQQAQAERASKTSGKTSALSSAVTLNENVASLQAAVMAQGELVRKLKGQTKDKSVWQPEVTKLLELKKQLAEAESKASAAPSAAPTSCSAASPEDILALEAAILAQGELVRKLKGQTKDKSVWQPEVTKLLELKKQLAEAESKASAAPSAAPTSCSAASPENILALEAAIIAQGEVVRKLKAETKDKAVWQPEVNKLLELKQKLVQAGGTPAAVAPKSGGKKK